MKSNFIFNCKETERERRQNERMKKENNKREHSSFILDISIISIPSTPYNNAHWVARREFARDI
jgi:hypothetical protein